jgi:hypothetical protein
MGGGSISGIRQPECEADHFSSGLKVIMNGIFSLFLPHGALAQKYIFLQYY